MKTVLITMTLLALGTGLAEPAVDEPKDERAPTKITSDSGEYDVEKRVATLRGNVRVADPAIEVTSTEMIVTFDEKNEAQRIEAREKVVITQKDKIARGSLAIYTPKDGNIELSGNPTIEMPQGNVQCERIRFNRDAQKVFFEGKMTMSIQAGTAGLPEIVPKKNEPKKDEKTAPKQ